MKKFYLPLILLISSAVMLQSCKKEGFFTATATTNLTQSTVFTDSARTAGFLANIYSNVGFSASLSRFTYNLIGTGGLEAACDEAEPSHTYATPALEFATGT